MLVSSVVCSRSHSCVCRMSCCAVGQLYRIQNPQAPLVMNENQAAYGMDEYPSGTNAVVAVISYTGFDMEDACVISKSSFERGFGHASVYKTLVRLPCQLRV